MITYTETSNIIIFCPSRKVTGGPEALHQLSHKLISLGLNGVYMYYLPKRKGSKPGNYRNYKTEEISHFEDSSENILVVPESMTFLVKKFPKSQKIIWWLSVDFYRILMDRRIRKQNFIKKLFYKQSNLEYHFEPYSNVVHWAQSFRSGLYLKQHKVSENQIDYVCDYIHPSFLEPQEITKDLSNKIVLYNPKKGRAEIALLIQHSPDLTWFPIQNMSSQEIKDVMSRALLYVDFGENPGRDKMLRESVSQDCCIVSGKNGSSAFYEDLMIPDQYKFEFNEENIPLILKLIRNILQNYPQHVGNFAAYKNRVLSEEKDFERKLKEIFWN